MSLLIRVKLNKIFSTEIKKSHKLSSEVYDADTVNIVTIVERV